MNARLPILLSALGGSIALAWWYFRNRDSGAAGDTVDAAANDAGYVSDATDSVLGEIQVTAQKIGLTNAPRGIRNNNPGNLDFIANPAHAWNGQIGSDGRYGIYDTPANGVRAIAKQLQVDYNRGAKTNRGLIAVWAPPSENNTEAYIGVVCRANGYGADDQLPLSAVLPETVTAIIQHENGQQPYSFDEINQWVYLS